MSIVCKRIALMRNTQRLRALFLTNNISKYKRSESVNVVVNGLNERPFTVGNQIKGSILNRNDCLFKSWVTLSICLSTSSLDASTYERIADQTLEHLYEELETIMESNAELKDSDISLNNGVITCNLAFNGIYVINKQTPNKQIWFSSPLSGPKRYDFIDKQWIYKRDGSSLFDCLGSELSHILKRDIKIKSLDIR